MMFMYRDGCAVAVCDECGDTEHYEVGTHYLDYSFTACPCEDMRMYCPDCLEKHQIKRGCV